LAISLDLLKDAGLIRNKEKILFTSAKTEEDLGHPPILSAKINWSLSLPLGIKRGKLSSVCLHLGQAHIKLRNHKCS
jgi:hypothetical protein